MDVIYEVPGVFRITEIRDFLPYVGSVKPVVRATPFLLQLRIADVAAVEHIELPGDIFGLLLRMDDRDALVMRKYLSSEFQMSEAMLSQIMSAPKSLLGCIAEAPVPAFDRPRG